MTISARPTNDSAESASVAAIARSHGLLRPHPPTGHGKWTGAVDYPASLPDVDEILAARSQHMVLWACQAFEAESEALIVILRWPPERSDESRRTATRCASRESGALRDRFCSRNMIITYLKVEPTTADDHRSLSADLASTALVANICDSC